MTTATEPLRRIAVDVGDGYDVTVGSGLLATAADVVAEQDVAIVTDANVGHAHAPALVSSLEEAGKRVTTFTVPAGEASKSLATWGELLGRVARSGLGRDGAVLALGGGVVGDLAGFLAASYLRGVAFYQFPTSLLAMVDASVGGKTGLDLREGKNLVGAFWQPRAVVADVNTLATLSPHEFRQGTIELVKHGYIRDPGLLTVVDEGWHTAASGDRLSDAVSRSVAVKAAVVSADERESGERVFLNFGHTLAHALEAASDLALQHGDAVAYGMLFAALLARERGHANVVPDLLELVGWLEPPPLPTVGFDDLLPYIARDKKAARGGTRYVLLRSVGDPYLASDVGADEQRSAFSALKELVA